MRKKADGSLKLEVIESPDAFEERQVSSFEVNRGGKRRGEFSLVMM